VVFVAREHERRRLVRGRRRHRRVGECGSSRK
jgi:hypothetical protein